MMRRAWMCSLALVPALAVAPAIAQQRAQIGSVQTHLVQPKLAAEPASQEAEPLQIRLLEGVVDGHVRVEVDLESPGSRMALLISNKETMLAIMGIFPAVLQGQAVVEMTRINPQTFAIDLPTEGLPTGVAAYLQAVAIEPGRIRSSSVAPLYICQPGQVCGAVIPGYYSGSAEFSISPLIAITRIEPNMSSWAVDIDVTVRSNDWDLWHQVTRQGPSGTEIFMVLKEPGPGEGQLDVVETHSVQVQLGALNPGRLIVYVGVTQLWLAPPSTLQFQQVRTD